MTVAPSSDSLRLQWLTDRAEIIDTVHNFALGVDTRDWSLFRSLFTDNVELDYSSYNGIDAHVRPADEWIADISWLFAGLDGTQHALSNPQVTIDRDLATCLVYVQAKHFLADELGGSFYSFGGYYTDELVRTVDGWRLCKVKLTAFWQRGNKRMMKLARERPGRPTQP
jgi:hypothetical protein